MGPRPEFITFTNTTPSGWVDLLLNTKKREKDIQGGFRRFQLQAVPVPGRAAAGSSAMASGFTEAPVSSNSASPST